MTLPAATHQPHEATRHSLLRALVFILLLFGLSTGGTALPGSARADVPAPKAPADTTEAFADTKAEHRVLAYYFYTTQRCTSCRKIEAYTAEAITTGFVEAIKDSVLVFQAINVDEEANEHFVKDYELFTKSVIIADERSGKQVAWKNLPKVWELLNDKEKFIRYIQDETRAYLAGKRS
mgnify:CR=1 FL=1